MTTTCAHHWIIDAAAGPTSRGVCSDCGAQQHFANALPDAPEERRKIRLGAEGAARGGDNRARAETLAPLRERFRELAHFGGLQLAEIGTMPEFAGVSPKTLKTWWQRANRDGLPAPAPQCEAPPPAPDTAAHTVAAAPETAHAVDPDALEMDTDLGPGPAGPDPTPQCVVLPPTITIPRVLAELLGLMPLQDDTRQRHVDWLDAWHAVYTLLYLGGR